MTGMATLASAMIEGVELKELVTHPDNRGFFREIIRDSDDFFTGFGQWSHSMMYTGTIKAWHYHQKQTDYWYVPIGAVRAVVIDIKNTDLFINRDDKAFEQDKDRPFDRIARLSYDAGATEIFALGENQSAQVLKIPPGVAHGLKVLQGPAHLFYITDKEYDPDDEGRIAFDALGYDWLKEEIK